MKGRQHSEQVRAQVIAALLAGQGVTEVATQYNLAKSVVSRLKASLSDGEMEQVGTQKRLSLATLIENLLRMSLETATRLAHNSQDEQWFYKQNAADVAILFGVITDKSIKIVEAAENASLNQILPEEKNVTPELVS